MVQSVTIDRLIGLHYFEGAVVLLVQLDIIIRFDIIDRVFGIKPLMSFLA